MKRELPILWLSCMGCELMLTFIHQFVFEAPYLRFYLLIPLFFMAVEWIYYGIETYARKQSNHAKATQVYMLYKTAKMLITLALVLGLAFLMPQVGVAFFIRLIATYIIMLIVETKLAMAWMTNKTKTNNE